MGVVKPFDGSKTFPWASVVYPMPCTVLAVCEAVGAVTKALSAAASGGARPAHHAGLADCNAAGARGLAPIFAASPCATWLAKLARVCHPIGDGLAVHGSRRLPWRSDHQQWVFPSRGRSSCRKRLTRAGEPRELIGGRGGARVRLAVIGITR